MSIVAHDAGTGTFGVATASLGLAVGSRVPALRADVGAAAVQAHSPASWRASVLDALARGQSAIEVRDALLGTDAAATAQVAIVDRHGRVAVLSGEALEVEAGDAQAPGVCCAANLMERANVPLVALAAYRESAAPTLSGRLLDALAAVDRIGGDVRGRQSAAIRVVTLRGADDAAGADLRVDDARDPMRELQRLHRLWQAHQLLRSSAGPDGLYRDIDRAHAALELAPDDPTCLGGAGLALLRAGRVNDAITVLRRLSVQEPRTRLRIQRLIDAGLLDRDAARRALDGLA